MAAPDPTEEPPVRMQGMIQRIKDPRPLFQFDCLPHYATAWERWGDNPDVARSLMYLGIKLTDAEAYRSRLTPVDLKQLSIPDQCAFSRDLDAFVFVTYGVLDALSQVVAEVAKARTQQEIKFPLIASILTQDVPQPKRWNRFRAWIEQVYRSPWYVDVRRLRNVINYGSVLSAPLNWPPDAHGVSQWLASYDRVLDTTEQGLALLLESET